jgi:hypothetical protein
MNKNHLHAGSHRWRSGPLGAVALTAFLAASAAAMGGRERSEPPPDAGEASDAGGRHLEWAIAAHRSATRVRYREIRACASSLPMLEHMAVSQDSVSHAGSVQGRDVASRAGTEGAR